MIRRSQAFKARLDRARKVRGLALMGVCNVTPDSFSDGGLYEAPERARARVDQLLAEGADILDVGGESTRPGALPVPAEEQLRRVLDVVRYAASQGACVSVDTADPGVAATCLEAGASAINDVSCLRASELGQAVARYEAALILMHSRGTPSDMAGYGHYARGGYADVVLDVCAEWTRAAASARALGVDESALVMDPGLGFAKTAAHSLELLRRLREIVDSLGVPVAVGASRKSFLTAVDEGAAPGERLGASLGVAIHAARSGASLLRVHDVRATRQAIDIVRRLGGD